MEWGCFDCKSTKNLRAIHNTSLTRPSNHNVVSTAKVQKIWEQFTTQTTKNSSYMGCFDCKSTKNLRAIHNSTYWLWPPDFVVSTAKVQKIWEQFTTRLSRLMRQERLFRLQKYKKFESNSQPKLNNGKRTLCCFDCKSTKNLRAIHNLL